MSSVRKMSCDAIR